MIHGIYKAELQMGGLIDQL